MGFFKRLFGKKDQKQVKTLPVKENENKHVKDSQSKTVDYKQLIEGVLPVETNNEKVNTEKKTQKYHVSQSKDDKSEHYKEWRVRKEGSEKTIKFFKTQSEAITYAEGLAEQADSTVVIHKVDGSIRKQNYTK
ncbi:DUF2188 domain-containing protein [Liberiplasma polymorphum]|uniref:DUF2188 domain-containing protein n=1 Tax=Liberiplasma polymorphum TaxID=3374570 RepID=UPI0037724DD9